MLSEGQIRLINNLHHPKFLATVDRQGQPNVVVVSSLEYFEGKLIFGNLMLWKTARNLQEDPAVAVLVIDPQLHYFYLEGSFLGFTETGPAVEHLRKSDMVRYNAYTGFRNAGIIELTHAGPLCKLSPARILGEYLRSRVSFKGGPVHFPQAVADKFAALKSIKVAAYYNKKLHLEIIPAVRYGGDCLYTFTGLPPGVKYAASVITPEVVSFQVKGGVKREGLQVDKVYACGPPVPGKQIYPLPHS